MAFETTKVGSLVIPIKKTPFLCLLLLYPALSGKIKYRYNRMF